ncbi:2-oxoglutarate dehydrogenase complex dihydrolipoyllysine-residue succinyltransferase [Mechercharimyces sp. CAU 1602]|uniref:2-oxoglutarate dehydrogenase complex dihydrolipoyllysine-residue succinyltransferase n=1 Tax=Mechercharimyces sp. CAU 1602 TaxID=2973933 RepID=UPI002161E7F7|nr:2-oxoglutarate dehydrogenase complex dihydrolipoyllysine-residue succinyltransferase [Mechercharimyces sp. CAU 1602]MCS1351649.1 2-oxoglutarate dehydrogenase complex dihydrolipoyllysine-residue succinyltransferase [Mechercharimyces sp. CAU 1602]
MIEIKVPELAESITEGTIANWVKKEGDSVSEGDVILELETDKVNLEVNAENSGTLQKIQKQEGDTVEVGEVIAYLGEGSGEGATSTPANSSSDAPAEESSKEESKTEEHQPQEQKGMEQEAQQISGSPSARRNARKHGSTPSSQEPMKKDDVKPEVKTPSVESSAPKVSSTTSEQNERPVERQRMSRRRQTIAKRLVEAQQNAAMLTTFNEIDMTAVMELRKRRKEAFKEQHDVNLGFMSFFTKAVVGALKAFPLVNAEIQGDEIVLKKFYDIGIAVSTEEGLVVPVVRNADQRSFAGIEQEIVELATKARSNSLTLKELQGGTFTITNGGIFGSLLSTPILNAPQVGILGMHKIQMRPVTVGDGMENRPMMNIALSYDHRIIDGREAVSFLVKVKDLLEDPELLLLEG